MSWPEFWLKYSGWQVRQQYEWEKTRLLAAEIRSNAFGAKKATKPEAIMRLSEIDKRNSPQYTPESMDAFIKRISEKEIKAGRMQPGQLIQLQKVTQE